MTQSTGDGTDQGTTPRQPAAPKTSPDAPAATTGAAPATSDAQTLTRVLVTGPVFTDAVEVEVDGERLSIGPGATALASDKVDAAIAAASDLGVTVEREEG